MYMLVSQHVQWTIMVCNRLLWLFQCTSIKSTWFKVSNKLVFWKIFSMWVHPKFFPYPKALIHFVSILRYQLNIKSSLDCVLFRAFECNSVFFCAKAAFSSSWFIKFHVWCWMNYFVVLQTIYSTFQYFFFFFYKSITTLSIKPLSVFYILCYFFCAC